MNQEKVIVIDFGGQYNQLVARRVRECNVYCEIYSYRTPIEQIKAMNPKGIILTGGPNSCYEADSPTYTKELFELGIPVLGLCYGAQLMMHVLGGKVEKAPVREYGKTEVMVDTTSPLFGNVAPTTICWMSHFDYISKTAPDFKIVAHTADCPVAAAENADKKQQITAYHKKFSNTCSILNITVSPFEEYNYSLSGIKAIIFTPYHSGTLNTNSCQFKEFCQKAKQKSVPMFVTGVVAGGEYQSMKAYEELNIFPVYNLPSIALLVKLWLEN